MMRLQRSIGAKSQLKLKLGQLSQNFVSDENHYSWFATAPGSSVKNGGGT
jgi:hypothetical protein